MADSIDEVSIDVTKKGPRYVYDMDLDTSKRYAKIQTQLSPVSSVEATRAVSSARILAQTPSYGTSQIPGIEHLEMPKGFGFWAQIEAPPQYFEQRPFMLAQADQLFPTITSEHLKACLDKLSLPLEQIATTIGEKREYAFEWEKLKEQEQMGKELGVLKEFFAEGHKLTQIAESIDQRRKQFQQG